MRNKLRKYLLIAKPFAFTLALMTIAVTTSSWAQTVYKSTDKDGTSYSEHPPTTPAKKAKTVEMTIDPNQNIIPADPNQQKNPYPTSQNSGTGNSSGNTGESRSSKIAEAEAALKSAQQALAAGTETQSGDFAGKKNGGVGPSTQRIERINDLQAAVERAQEELERAKNTR
ncbi:MAG: hypothetical protein JWM78_368 [Verrucomicrobiaceae bacterium]|nr:hypothetical protein [Verrucomicrobiaceae bacterium]